MTEAEWLGSGRLRALFSQVLNAPSDRKYRLLSLTLGRAVWPEPTDHRCARAWDMAERYAEGTAGPDELARARQAAQDVVDERTAALFARTHPLGTREAKRLVLDRMAEAEAAVHCTLASGQAAAWQVVRVVSRQTPESHACCDFLRDIFGNPFRPVAFDPRWRTSTAVAIAEAAYEARDFAALPILADALEDAGCEDADVLAHGRSAGPHVRGCWVVDGVLGKT